VIFLHLIDPITESVWEQIPVRADLLESVQTKHGPVVQRQSGPRRGLVTISVRTLFESRSKTEAASFTPIWKDPEGQPPRQIAALSTFERPIFAKNGFLVRNAADATHQTAISGASFRTGKVNGTARWIASPLDRHRGSATVLLVLKETRRPSQSSRCTPGKYDEISAVWFTRQHQTQQAAGRKPSAPLSLLGGADSS